MPQIRALSDYLTDHPPTHLLVAAYVGYEPPVRQEQLTPEIIMARLAMAGFATGGLVKTPDEKGN